jgi:hypothetical protein
LGEKMKLANTCGIGIVALLTATLALAAGASAAHAALILKSEGQAAQVGTPTLGSLRFGPCGEFESEGTLASNDRRADVSNFSSTEGTIGGCGEGGPSITGSVSKDRLTENGRFVVVSELIYTTTINECSYGLKRLRGAFTIPGLTQATVSGTARRLAPDSETCPKMVHVTGVEAALYDLNTVQLFEAEL